LAAAVFADAYVIIGWLLFGLLIIAVTGLAQH
jgi:hypothetical protein